MENVLINDIDFIDIDNNKSMTVGGERVAAGEEYNRVPLGETEVGENHIPKEESIHSKSSDDPFVLTPNKGEIKVETILPDNIPNGEIEFIDGDQGVEINESSTNINLEPR